MTKEEQLRGMIKDRDSLRVQYNNAIAQMIQPTALTAMFQMFELEAKDVEWSAIDLVDDSIAIVVKLTYTTTEDSPEFLKKMDIISNAGPNARTRTLRVGLPLNLVFASHDEIKAHLIGMVDKSLQAMQPKQAEQPVADFDPSILTPQQLQQLRLYQTMQKAGEKNE